MFVRCLCHVLSVDCTYTEEEDSTRRSLLQFPGLREFANDRRFIENSLPVPLHDVICKYFNAVVELDVLGDSRLWTLGEEQDGKKAWACVYCGDPYDLTQIEMDLLRTAQKTFSSYQVQDFFC